MVQAPHESGQAKVGHLTDQVGIDQHISGRHVPVDKVSLREVTHPCTNPPEHPNKLEDAELALVLLEELRWYDGGIRRVFLLYSAVKPVCNMLDDGNC